MLGRRRLARKYAESFSIYALSRIFTGSLREKLFWGTVLAGAFSLIGIVTYGFLNDFISYDVRTDIRLQHVDNIDYPSLTICPEQVDIHCHNNVSLRNESCHTRPAFVVKYTHPLNHNIQLEVEPNRIYGECVTFNPNGNITAQYTGVDISVKFSIEPLEEKEMIYLVGMHDYDGSRVALHEMTEGHYEFQLREIMDIHRLPSPYPSHCTNGKERSMFPGSYTQEKCKDTCLVKLLVRKCGNAPDMFKPFMTAKEKELVRENDNIRDCWNTTYKDFYTGGGHKACECPLPCEDVSYDYIFLNQEKWDTHYSPGHPTEINLICTSLNKKHLIEVPAYPLTKFLSDIGGWLGLLVGMSALSIVEIFAYVALKMSIHMPNIH